MRHIVKIACLCSASMAAFFLAAGAAAQETAPPADAARSAPEDAGQQNPEQPGADYDNKDIVVSGTRVVRDGYDAPTPTTVIGAELLHTDAPASLGDVLQNLPAFRNVATTGTASQTVSGTGGQSFANLRGLGATRTLVLVDGHRIVPSTASATVDLGILPMSLISRVDVVTGGASAAWGSDAVAGVVNFVLDDKFTGLKGGIEGGVSQRGDNASGRYSLAWGGHALRDRLHLLAGGEYYANEGVPARSRPWSDGGSFWNDVPNPAYAIGNGQPQFLRRENYYFSNINFNGVVTGSTTTTGATSTAFRGTQFLPGGGTAPFTFCNEGGIAGQCSSAQDLPHFNYFTLMSAPLKRGSAYGRVGYDVTPDINVHADILYGRSRTLVQTIWPSTNLAGAITILPDNPYLPSGLATQMAAQGIASLTLARSFRDFPEAQIRRDTETTAYSAGADAKFGDWRANAHLSYGRTRFLSEIRDVTIVSRLKEATDTIRVNGTIVCRSGNAACRPLNPFGDGSSTQPAIDYVTGDIRADLRLTQFAAGATVNGEPFSTWAGPVSLAVGGEYRRETADQTVDPLSAARAYMLLNPQAFRGSLNVKEGFAETVVPLAKDAPFLHSLDLNAAVRYTDYSTSGGVTTWKVGGTWSPVADLTLRGTRSRDIRAPNILELYQAPTQQTTQIRDPRTNAAVVFQALIGGNPALKAEKADTTAAGIVYKPEWLHGFATSFDYYRIKVNGAISTLAAQDIVNRCEAGIASFCPLVTRNGANVITAVDLRALNYQTLKTSGFDIEASYRADLGNAGAVSARVLANYLIDYTTNDGQTTIDIAGSINDGLPKWSWTVSGDYRKGPFTWFVKADRIGAGQYNPRFTFDDNSVKSVWYVDSTIEATIPVQGLQEVTFYLNVANLLDQGPPRGFGFQTGPYDRIGRTYKAGLRFRL